MNKEKIIPYLFFLIPLLFVFLFLLFPMASPTYLSFHEWSGLGAPTFIGIRNYVKIFTDPALFRSLENTIIWVVLTVLNPVILGLIIAIIMTGQIKGETIFKSIFCLPLALSPVVLGLIWLWMYDPRMGALNTILRALKLDFLCRTWLAVPGLNTIAMIFSNAWAQAGFGIIILLAGLRSIPPDLIDAAKLDCRSSWQALIHIIFPLLKPFFMILIAITIINTLKIFDIVYMMTFGGPYRSSETLALSMFRESFRLFHFGYASAIASVLFLVILIVIVVFIHAFERE